MGNAMAARKPQKPAALEGQRPADKALRLHGSIARDIGVLIVSGRYRPGHVLDGEVEASEQRKVSRTAYREAVRILSAKGLVHSRPRVGTRVSPLEQWHLLDPDVLSWAFSGEPEPEVLHGLFELRAIVEPAAARLAAERRTRDDLKVMKTALGVMRQKTLATEAGRAADRDFHDAILQATHNDALIVLSASIGAAVAWTTQFKQRARALPRNPIPDHVRVYDAIAAGDGEAASEAMRALIDLALDDTRSAMA